MGSRNGTGPGVTFRLQWSREYLRAYKDGRLIFLGKAYVLFIKSLLVSLPNIRLSVSTGQLSRSIIVGENVVHRVVLQAPSLSLPHNSCMLSHLPHSLSQYARCLIFSARYLAVYSRRHLFTFVRSMLTLSYLLCHDALCVFVNPGHPPARRYRSTRL